MLVVLIMLYLIMVAAESKKLLDIYIQKINLKKVFYIDFIVKVIILFLSVSAYVNVKNVIFLLIVYSLLLFLYLILLILAKKLYINDSYKKYEYIESFESLKVRNSFLISFGLIIVSNSFFYIFDFKKYNTFIIILFFAGFFVFLVYYFNVISRLISVYKGKISNSLISYIFLFLFLLSNVYFYIIGEFIGRNMIFSIYLAVGLLFNLPYFLFKEKLAKNWFKYKDKID
jgi:hypothetical protein